MFSQHFTLTKRHLAILFMLVGILGFAAIIAVDILDVGRQGGIGPAQRIALGLMVGLTLLGLSLLPAGNHPA